MWSIVQKKTTVPGTILYLKKKFKLSFLNTNPRNQSFQKEGSEIFVYQKWAWIKNGGETCAEDQEAARWRGGQQAGSYSHSLTSASEAKGSHRGLLSLRYVFHLWTFLNSFLHQEFSPCRSVLKDSYFVGKGVVEKQTPKHNYCARPDGPNGNILKTLVHRGGSCCYGLVLF